MTEIELLNWLRGPGLQISVGVFLFGLLFRLAHNFLLGRKPNLAEQRGSTWGPGLKTIVRRSFYHPDRTARGYYTLIAGYLFHIGFLVTLFFLAQHIKLFESLFGVRWPALPPGLIDIFAVIGIAALVAVLIHRLTDPVVRSLSEFADYFTWFLTIAPLGTGFMLMHKAAFPYQTLLIAHIISVEALLFFVPFTKLSHMVTLFVSRWYNGAIAGYKGVQS